MSLDSLSTLIIVPLNSLIFLKSALFRTMHYVSYERYISLGPKSTSTTLIEGISYFRVFLVAELGVSPGRLLLPLSWVSKRRSYISESFTLQKSMSFIIFVECVSLLFLMEYKLSVSITDWSLLIEGLALYIFFSTFFEVSCKRTYRLDEYFCIYSYVRFSPIDMYESYKASPPLSSKKVTLLFILLNFYIRC